MPLPTSATELGGYLPNARFPRLVGGRCASYHVRAMQGLLMQGLSWQNMTDRSVLGD